MSGKWSESEDQKRKWRLFNGPQRDPTRRHAKAGVPYYRRGKDRVLMPDDFMPIGAHSSKHMRVVPPEYLLWVDSQPWAKNWMGWSSVSDYISRFITCDPETSQSIQVPTTDIIFVDRLRQYPTNLRCFAAGSAHLHTLPGYDDFLHAFAVGALGLKREYYQYKQLPHYDLTVGKHSQALANGAVPIEDDQLVEHKATWVTFIKSRPLHNE